MKKFINIRVSKDTWKKIMILKTLYNKQSAEAVISEYVNKKLKSTKNAKFLLANFKEKEDKLSNKVIGQTNTVCYLDEKSFIKDKE